MDETEEDGPLIGSNELIHDLLGLDTTAKPCEPRCDDEYCAACAMAECPHKEPLHRHHDGCPACWQEELRKSADYKDSGE